MFLMLAVSQKILKDYLPAITLSEKLSPGEKDPRVCTGFFGADSSKSPDDNLKNG
jgi:hypothetical protein